MIWLAAGEAVALVVLAAFAIALVHSYAGLAARVEALAGTAQGPAARSASSADHDAAGVGAVAQQVVGVSTAGDGVVVPLVDVERNTLLAFLTSTCTSCQGLWSELARGTGDVVPSELRLLVVTKGPEHESPTAIEEVAPAGCDVVMSSAAWSDFRIPGSPYFVLVERTTGSVLGEGTALSWPRVLDLAGVAAGDDKIAAGLRRDHRKPLTDLAREEAVDQLLLDAGILPGHASLYPEHSSGEETTTQ